MTDSAFKTKSKRTLIPICLLCVVMLPAVVHADFAYTTNNGTITIKSYYGSGAVTIPSSVGGLPVTSIGYQAFFDSGVTSVTIPNSVTNIGGEAFALCFYLTRITIPSSVVSMGDVLFINCTRLNAIDVAADNTNYSSVTGVLFNKSQTTLIECPPGLAAGSYTVPSSVTNIGSWAFVDCDDLTNVTIPGSVISIEGSAFMYCGSLTSVYFQGNAPDADSTAFYTPCIDYDQETIYYLPGTTGWSATLGSRPTKPWMLPNPTILNFEPDFGVRTNCFGFTMSWATNIPVLVEACTDLSTPVWTPLTTNTLTEGASYFSDPQWTNYPGRFYRLRSP